MKKKNLLARIEALEARVVWLEANQSVLPPWDTTGKCK
jgi:hypothetical protein